MAVDGWREVTLESVAAEITVGHVGPMASEYVANGIPFLRSQNVEYLRIETDDMKFITPEFHNRLRKSSLSPGDVVIVRTGKPGTCAVVPDSLPTANCSDLVIVRCGPELDAHFLAYYVNSIASHHVSAHLVGAVQQHFNVGSARSMLLHLPQLPEQCAIAHILGTLDDKIELNRRMNETLEATARALFKSWFVDFDPVRAKVEGRDPGLPEHIADLFPDRFDDSELGEIPAGWTIKSLDHVAQFLNGLALQKYPPEKDHYLPAIKIAELRRGVTSSTGRASTKIPSQYVVENGDVLFSWSGSLEVQLWTGGRGALNQHLFKVTSEFHPKWFYYYWIKQHLPEFRAIAADKATTMGHIKRQHLVDALTVVPPDSMLQEIGTIMELIVSEMINNDLQSHNLAGIRDTLLPKLIAGELQVPDAMQFSDEAMP